MTQLVVNSKSGMVHVVQSTYTNQTGGTNYVGACNKMVRNPQPTSDNRAVTCKQCGKVA